MSAVLTPTALSLGYWSRPPHGDAGRCLHIGNHVFLHLPGASRRLRLPSRPDWTALVARAGTAVLLLGLEPLSQSAGASQLDTYLDSASGVDRLLFGLPRSR